MRAFLTLGTLLLIAQVSWGKDYQPVEKRGRDLSTLAEPQQIREAERSSPLFSTGCYDRIPRLLKKEPATTSQARKYGLLVFGPEVKLHVWVAVEGERIYLDRNADGDLTDPNEAFAKLEDCKDISFGAADGKTRYVLQGVTQYMAEKPEARHALMVDVAIEGTSSFHQYCDLALQEFPAKAHLAHFHGPLTVEPRKILGKLPAGLALKPGDNELFCNIGTINPKVGSWVVVRTHHADKGVFPRDVHPVVDVEIPMKNGPPAKMRYALDKFC